MTSNWKPQIGERVRIQIPLDCQFHTVENTRLKPLLRQVNNSTGFIIKTDETKYPIPLQHKHQIRVHFEEPIYTIEEIDMFPKDTAEPNLKFTVTMPVTITESLFHISELTRININD